MKYLLNCISFISLMVLFSFFDNFGMKEYDYLFTVTFVGDAGVGKTQIVNRYVKNIFEKVYNPIICSNFFTKDIEYNGKKIKLQLWDTAGQEKLRNITKIFYKNSRLIVFVYAINDKKSFENIPIWVNDVKTQNKDAKLLLVGNKCDLEKERRVRKEEAIEYAKKNNMKFIEVSAKTGKGIEDMFISILSKLLEDNDLFFWNKYCSCCPCL